MADLPPDQQHDAVERAAAGDAELVDAVLQLLDEDAHPHPLLKADLADLAAAALDDDRITSLVQQGIGPYRLLRLLGEGGMGVVYLAERSDIGGLVAIKLLRDAWMSPMRRDRFALEQQTLARLNHPSIARIYDASTLDDGTPWFVMEFADGRPLTAWLHERHGTVRDDLLIFRQICEAVRYAHSHAIVHRDLKPSNILVNASGEVKLLDFGIAKQLELNSDPERTIDALRLMTPAYAAPEQRNGGSIGVFTDVYALGVLLYEMLVGHLPVADPAQAHAMRSLPKPSIAAREAGVNQSRSQLERLEWADLDVLCLAALQPEPDRRYGSVDALLHDLNAALEGRVLLARPDSIWYVAGKFARRNRAALLSAAAGILLLVAAASLFTVRLAHARDAAVTEAARTARVQHFTENLFDGGDASAGPAIDLRTADLLKRGQVEAEGLSGDPRMQADLFTTLGTVYAKLGQLDRADILLERALRERHDAFGPEDRQYAQSLVSMGLLRKVQGRMADAETLLRQALTLSRRTLPRTDPDIEHALWALGSVLSLRGQYPESKSLLEEAVLRGSTLKQSTPQLADDLTQLADVHFYLADYATSDSLNRQALAIDRKLFGDRHPAVGRILNSLGNIAENQGRTAESEAYFRQALDIDQAWYGPDHPDVAADLTSLSHILVVSKKFDEAHAVLARALAIEQRAYGQVHSSVATVYNQLGLLAYTRDLDDEAELAFRQALAIWLQVYGEHHQFIGLCYANLAGVYIDRKDYVVAEQMSRKALEVYSVTLSEDHLNTAIVHVKLGRILLRQHRYADAEPETLKGYHYFSTHAGPNQSYLNGARSDLIDIEAHLGKPAAAAGLTAQLKPASKALPH